MIDFLLLLLFGTIKGVLFLAGSIVMRREKTPSWIIHIQNRIRQNKNFLCLISGATGSGKSYSGLSICYKVDPEFSPERIVTNMRQLMKLINSGKLKSGSAILWDECGIDISARSWQSLTNKMINFLLQTFRHKNFILVFTTPHLDFVDSSTRKLFHAEFVTQSIDHQKKTCKLKPYLLQYNSRNRKFYYKYLRIATKTGVAPLKAWNIPMPPAWMVEEYERLKEEFTTELNLDIEKQLNKDQGKKPLTILQKQTKELMEQHDDVKKVAEIMGLTTRTVYFHINALKNKGYLLEKPPKQLKEEDLKQENISPGLVNLNYKVSDGKNKNN